MGNTFSISCAALLLVTAIALFSLNIYGVFFKSLRSANAYKAEHLRFRRKAADLEEFYSKIKRFPGESDKEFAVRLNEAITTGLVHIDWEIEDVDRYHLRVPPWENYILFILGHIPGSRDFKKYHFCDYKKTMERGVSSCIDAATVLSGILGENGIKTRIIAFPAHIIVEVNVDKDGVWWSFDPDFGAVLPYSVETILKDPKIIREYYISTGHPVNQVDYLEKAFSVQPRVFSNRFTFGPKKAIFEYATYAMIWIIPVVLVILSVKVLRHI